MMKKLLFIALVSSVYQASAAEIYQCKDASGQPVFSQRPCGADAKKRVVEGPENLGSVAIDAEVTEEVRAASRSRQIERDLTFLHSEVRRLRLQMEAELRGLRAKKSRANNNLAGAAWEQSISTEMQAVTDNYRFRIASVESKIEQLQEERRRLSR